MMIKRLLPLAMSLCLLFSVMPILSASGSTATADEPEEGPGGVFGISNMTWELRGSTLYITGSGYMDGWISEPPWHYYRESIQKVVMKGNIKNVYAFAFRDHDNLTSIVWPKGLQMINEAAFDGCASLTSVEIPDTVTYISPYAFSSCGKLSSVKLPQSLVELGSYAFNGCSSLESIAFPSGIKWIADGTFGYTGITNLVVPDHIKDVGYAAFKGCSNLKSVTIGKKIKTLQQEVFAYCPSLSTITIPGNVTRLGSKCFDQCTSLESIKFQGDMPQFDLYFKQGCELTIYYPSDNKTWTESKIQSVQQYFLGELEVLPYDMPISPTHPTEPKPTTPQETKPTTKPITMPTTEPSAETLPEVTLIPETTPVTFPQDTLESTTAPAAEEQTLHTSEVSEVSTPDTPENEAPAAQKKETYPVIWVMLVAAALSMGTALWQFISKWKRR